MKKTTLQSFPEHGHHNQPPITTYPEAAIFISKVLNIIVPEPETITMDFINDDIFKILQSDESQFYITEEKEFVKRKKEAAGILMKQIRFNKDNNQCEKINQTAQKETEKKTISSIVKPTEAVEVKLKPMAPQINQAEIIQPREDIQIIKRKEEIIEVTLHPDFIVLENNLKILSGFQSTEDKKREALGVIQDLIELYLGKEGMQKFQENYINSTNGNYRLQKISVDYTMKSITKTPLQNILSELKNKLS